MQHELPKRLKTSISVEEILKVENWWDKLSEENQLQLASLYNEEAPNRKNIVSIYLCGKYVEQERVIPNNAFWVNHFYNYIVNHELVIDETKIHVGGVCSSNKIAENSIRTGIIRNGFICPLNDSSCLMKSILEFRQGLSLQLSIKFELEEVKNV